MGANEAWLLRKDDKVGSVDLSILALSEDDYDRPESISFRTKTGLWYELKPQSETEICSPSVICPVEFKRSSRSGPYENVLDAAQSIPLEIKNFITEGRHFPKIGHVAVLNEIVTEGDRLWINGHRTSPLDIAWVTERVDPASGEVGGHGYGKQMPDGTVKLIMLKTIANF